MKMKISKKDNFKHIQTILLLHKYSHECQQKKNGLSIVFVITFVL